ncbi:MAG: hypothetical protein KC621_07050 [Myxococcales bacterium]|nr:hypothetical protein [Myxococcales bacterium]
MSIARGLWRSAVLLAGLAVSSTPAVAGNNLFGGQIVEQSVGYVGAGYPDLEVGIHLPISARLEVTPNVRFSYVEWRGLPEGRDVTLSPGVDARLQAIDSGDLHGSLTLSVPFHLHFVGTNLGPVGVGLLYPGFIMDHSIGERWAIDFGLRVESDFFMELFGGYPLFVRLPVLVGVDVAASDVLQLALKVEGGPTYDYESGGFVRASLCVGLAL